jgi:uncharacterized protein (TIGR02001 family)
MDIRMRKIVLCAAALPALILACPAYAAPADSSMPQLTLPNTPLAEAAAVADTMPTFTASVTGASNYIFRGVSQSENDPAIFGSARATLNGFYAGAGMENVDFHNSIAAEYDLSAGWTPKVEGFDLDLGIVRYGYVNEPAHVHIDTAEIKAIVTHEFGPATLGAAIFYTPNYFGTGHDGEYFEGRGSYAITEKLTASGALGRQLITTGGSYTTWNAGLGFAITKNFGVDVHYYDTEDQSHLGKLHGSHVVGAIKASF